MYLLFFSRAKYTEPNFPFPSGLPMSKSSNCEHEREIHAKHTRQSIITLIVDHVRYDSSRTDAILCTIQTNRVRSTRPTDKKTQTRARRVLCSLSTYLPLLGCPTALALRRRVHRAFAHPPTDQRALPASTMRIRVLFFPTNALLMLLLLRPPISPAPRTGRRPRVHPVRTNGTIEIIISRQSLAS